MSYGQEVEIYDPPAANGSKDYILQIKVKNGPLLRAIRMRGFQNVNQFCRATGMHPTIVGKYLSLKQAPISTRGKWSQSALVLAKHLRLPPESLFPEQHLERALAKASGEIEVSKEEIATLIENNYSEDSFDREKLCGAVGRMLEVLTPRQERVLRLRHGFNGEPKSLEEVGRALNMTGNRVRQIERQAIRKLRGFKHTKAIKQLSDAGYAIADDIIAARRKRQQSELKELRAREEKQNAQREELNARAAAINHLTPIDDDGTIWRQLKDLPTDKLLRLYSLSLSI